MLYLDENQLIVLPTEIGQLKFLHTLDLLFNQLTNLPLTMAHLKALESLDLSSNRFTQLPPEIAQLRSGASHFCKNTIETG